MEKKKKSNNGETIENLARKNLSQIAKKIDENANGSDPRFRHVYQCKDCDKKYDTFQALGGHRASHRKLKPNDGGAGDGSESSSQSSSPKMHGCKFCGVEFPIGQALGGHMRRHQGLKSENNSIVNVKVAVVDEHPNRLIRIGSDVVETVKNPPELQTAEGGKDGDLRRQEVDYAEVVKCLQAAGEGETAESSTPVVAREEFQCCDLNLLPEDDDDSDDEVQVRKFYYFL